MGTAEREVRLGILVIHNDPVAETELWRMAPPEVTVHTARFESPTSTGAEYTGSPWEQMLQTPDVSRGLTQLAQVGLRAICLCFGSPSFFGGHDFDEGFTAEAARLADGTPVCTAAQAICAALSTAGVDRPLVVMPPWFTQPTFDATERYLVAAGVRPAEFTRFDLGAEWNGVARHRIFDQGGRSEVRTAEVRRQVSAGFSREADGVLIPGSGFRSWEAIEPLERELGVPVITSNQASLWYLLQLAGVRLPVPGGGRLFGPPPVRASAPARTRASAGRNAREH